MTKILLLRFLIFFALLHHIIDCARILVVVPWPGISHQVVFRPFTQELARRGHEVTVITADPAFPKGQTPSNLTEVDIRDISYDAWNKLMVKRVKVNGIVEEIKFTIKILNELMETQFKSDPIQRLINESLDFDLVILEACMRPLLVFSHIYKAPVILYSSLGSTTATDKAFGIPDHPLLYPSILAKKVYNHTFWDKLTELYSYFASHWYFNFALLDSDNEIIKNAFGPGIPSVDELYKNVDMLFVNIHPMWEENVPMPANVIHIWGIHKRVEKELPEDIKTYLDSSKHGVIFMSFGSSTQPSSLPTEKIQAFVKVFSELPYDILWKWDKDELPGRSENIRIGKWFPQSDILRHPKVKLFITQGGLQSTEEAINAGVPLVGVPVIADQSYNVEKYQKFKIGEKLDLRTLTEEDIRYSIQTVLEDDSYRQNIVKLRTLMRDEPEPALERAVWWTEYVLRHKGARHLRAAAANLSWTEYYELELIRNIVICAVITLLGILFSIRFVLNSFVTPKSKVKKN